MRPLWDATLLYVLYRRAAGSILLTGVWSNRFPLYRGQEVIETAIPTSVTASRVHEYLSEVAYPASRQDLIDYARQNNAPDEIVRTLEQLPERRYVSPEIVTETIGMAM